MGVWIETYGEQIRNRFGFVTPFVGVWIETQYDVAAKAFTKSHPSWVCGLKPNIIIIFIMEVSHTLRGCVD